MPLAALIRMTPKPGKAEQLRTLVARAAAHNRTEPGNLLTLVLEDPADPDATMMFEVFADADAVDAHRAAPHAKADAPAIHALMATPLEARWFHADDWSDLWRARGAPPLDRTGTPA